MHGPVTDPQVNTVCHSLAVDELHNLGLTHGEPLLICSKLPHRWHHAVLRSCTPSTGTRPQCKELWGVAKSWILSASEAHLSGGLV